MNKKLNGIARQIIEENQYLSLGTIDKENGIWLSPVCYAHDKDFNFYFVSMPVARHSKNIDVNGKVMFTIFDSHQKWGEGLGLQVEGKAEKLGVTASLFASKLYFSRKYPYGSILGSFAKGLRAFLKNSTFVFYKLTPSVFWMNNPDADVDERVEVKP
jgi:uncharacterized protein YhbP (UPF0306 family)